LETRCVEATYFKDDPEAEATKAPEMHHSGNKYVDVFFAEGATGGLRVSHRELDEEASTQHQAVYTHTKGAENQSWRDITCRNRSLAV
jgi:hypothetical protein